MLTEAAAQVAPGGQRSAHARSLHRPGAGTAVVAGAESLVELGPAIPRVCFAILIRRAGGS